jgi:hypothetical protein
MAAAVLSDTPYPETIPAVLSREVSSGVSWSAVLAGALGAAALSLILLFLGTGLGLAAISPWTGGLSARTMSWSTIAWIIATALMASGLGGYLAGRLRGRWPALHTYEVYFRDTAHGFLAWAVATLLTAAVLGSAIGTLAGAGTAGMRAAAAATSSASPSLPDSSTAAMDSNRVMQSAYAADALFRPGPTQPATATQLAPQALGDPGLVEQNKGEITRIFATNLQAGQLSQEDTGYVGQLIAQRTGLSQQDAEARVNQFYTSAFKKLQDSEAKAKQLADQARKNAAYASLWIFVSLLGGAFFASLMATVGGRRRDFY